MIHDIHFPDHYNPPVSTFEINHHHYPCSLGRTGITANKKEGDGGTPLGQFYLRTVYYRADRIPINLLKTKLPLHAITPQDAWCDDVKSPHYNKHIMLPSQCSYEKLWREDHLYDIVVVVGYNDHPIITGKGSAIFIHIARDHFAPTQGCIGLMKKDMAATLPFLSADSMVVVTRQGIHIN